MRRYENIFLCPPGTSEEKINETLERVKALVARSDGEVVDVERWGERPLAYELKGQRRALYFRIDFVASSNLTELIAKIDELYRYSDHVMRFMTIRTHSDTTLEKARADIASKPKTPQAAPEAVPPAAGAEAPVS